MKNLEKVRQENELFPGSKTRLAEIDKTVRIRLAERHLVGDWQVRRTMNSHFEKADFAQVFKRAPDGEAIFFDDGDEIVFATWRRVVPVDSDAVVDLGNGNAIFSDSCYRIVDAVFGQPRNLQFMLIADDLRVRTYQSRAELPNQIRKFFSLIIFSYVVSTNSKLTIWSFAIRKSLSRCN